MIIRKRKAKRILQVQVTLMFELLKQTLNEGRVDEKYHCSIEQLKQMGYYEIRGILKSARWMKVLTTEEYLKNCNNIFKAIENA